MHENLIILSGGASSRMKKQVTAKGLTEEETEQANKRSKSLIGVGVEGRPLMDYLLFNAKLAGYKYIYLVISEEGNLFKEFYGKEDSENNFHGLNISFVTQYVPRPRTKPFGTADALYHTLKKYPKLNKQCYTVCNSDNLYSYEALFALRATKKENAFISYSRDSLEFSSERISRFALAKLGEENFLLDIIEKPKLEEIDNFRDTHGKLRVSMNIFKFNGAIAYSYIKGCPINPERDEKELPTAILNMIRDHPNSMFGIPFSEHVPDLTGKNDIVAVKEYLKKNYAKLNW